VSVIIVSAVSVHLRLRWSARSVVRLRYHDLHWVLRVLRRPHHTHFLKDCHNLRTITLKLWLFDCFACKSCLTRIIFVKYSIFVNCVETYVSLNCVPACVGNFAGICWAWSVHTGFKQYRIVQQWNLVSWQSVKLFCRNQLFGSCLCYLIPTWGGAKTSCLIYCVQFLYCICTCVKYNPQNVCYSVPL